MWSDRRILELPWRVKERGETARLAFARGGRYAALWSGEVGVAEVQNTIETIQMLRDDFRRQLEIFYARLKLAPPYHSVEKAVAQLTANLRAMTPEEQQHLVTDPVRQWGEYRRAFIESGLNQKHRGPILGLIRSKQTHNLPPEHEQFLQAFL